MKNLIAVALVVAGLMAFAGEAHALYIHSGGHTVVCNTYGQTTYCN